MVGLREVCHTVTLRLVQGMLLRQLCVYGTSGEKKVVRRDEQVLDHVMWPHHGMTTILSAWPWRTVQLYPSVLSRRWSTATGLDLSASTVRRRLLRAGLVARIPLRRLPKFRDHQRLRLQWACERRHWRAEWRNVVFLDESRFNMSYNDGCIRVRRYAGDRNMRACILQRHRVPTPSVMVWGAIGYNMRYRLLRIEGNLKSNRYIREVL